MYMMVMVTTGNVKDENMARTPPTNPKARLTCMDCGREGPLAITMQEARDLAACEGWQVGMRGATRINGWEEDFCPDCKTRHPRTYCSGWRAKCSHRSLYTLTRVKDGHQVYACGSHLTILVKETLPAGKIELEETPV